MMTIQLQNKIWFEREFCLLVEWRWIYVYNRSNLLKRVFCSVSSVGLGTAAMFCGIGGWSASWVHGNGDNPLATSVIFDSKSSRHRLDLSSNLERRTHFLVTFEYLTISTETWRLLFSLFRRYSADSTFLKTIAYQLTRNWRSNKYAFSNIYSGNSSHSREASASKKSWELA